MEIKHAHFSCQGTRASNQDRLLEPVLTPTGAWVAAIADGVGGALGGDVAAQIAVDRIAEVGGSSESVNVAFFDIASRLSSYADRNVDFRRMATTLSVALIDSSTVEVFHVGDTRIYHLRGAGLNDLTQDQTELAELRRKGILTEYQAKRYRRKNVLTSALSAEGEFHMYTKEASLIPFDRLLMITDGVYGKLTRGTILNLSLENENLSAFTHALRMEVEGRGPEDNFSAVVIEVS